MVKSLQRFGFFIYYVLGMSLKNDNDKNIMKNNKSSTKGRDFLITITPECRKRELRQPKGQNLAGVDDSGVKFLYGRGFISKQMRVYLAKSIADSGREIRCEKCNSYEDLEFHHKKYDFATINDISVLCVKCHRNAKTAKKIRRSTLKTIFENGKRFCCVSGCQFEY